VFSLIQPQKTFCFKKRFGEAPFGEAPFGEAPFGEAPFGEVPFAVKNYKGMKVFTLTTWRSAF
jgi:hypothetical protein